MDKKRRAIVTHKGVGNNISSFIKPHSVFEKTNIPPTLKKSMETIIPITAECKSENIFLQ